ncbi:MAG: helix-turn-helix domain-containing protein [Methanosarcinales archaeon]
MNKCRGLSCNETEPDELEQLLINDCPVEEVAATCDKFNLLGAEQLRKLTKDFEPVLDIINEFFVRPAVLVERLEIRRMVNNAQMELYRKLLNPEEVLDHMAIHLRYHMDGKPGRIEGDERREIEAMFAEGWGISTLARLFDRSKSSIHAVVQLF